MIMTENTTAIIFFADLLLPLHRSNRRRGVHYFMSGPDEDVASYWEAPVSRTGGIERLGVGDGDGAALLGRLGNYWTENGEPMLPRLLPGLEALWQDLFEPQEEPQGGSATVTFTVYPLF
jgi:hypothetical protein